MTDGHDVDDVSMSSALAWERGEREDVLGSLDQQVGGLNKAVLELLADPAVLGPDLLGGGLSEDRAHQGRDQSLEAEREALAQTERERSSRRR